MLVDLHREAVSLQEVLSSQRASVMVSRLLNNYLLSSYREAIRLQVFSGWLAGWLGRPAMNGWNVSALPVIIICDSADIL